MKNDIIQNIIWNAGSIENLVTLKQDDETRKEYRERLFEEAHELFMDSVEELELGTVSDDIRDEAIQEIVDMLSGKSKK